MMLALLTAILAGSAPNVEPQVHSFSAVFGTARLSADCFGRSPCIVPIAGEPLRGYEAAFAKVLAKFLVDVRFRKHVEPDFSFSDWSKFELALNTLQPYFSCLDNEFRSANAAQFKTTVAVDALATEVDNRCRVHRDKGLSRIDFIGPDFVTFDPIRDGSSEGAALSELLQQVRAFSTAYNAGVRGHAWRRTIGVAYTLPAPREN